MEGQTPTFCNRFSKKRCYFSDLCENTLKYNSETENKRKDCLKFLNLKEENCNRKRSKSKKNCSHKKSRKNSKSKTLKDKICKFEEIKNDDNFKNVNINLYTFIRNHRFILRDDFNEKNVNKFLTSKEDAFDIPFILNNEIIIEY